MLGLLKIGIFTVFWLPLVALGLYALSLTIYRLVLSPLAKFPGPKLAALTRKYESYYEAVENYEYLWKIKQMHETYGELLKQFWGNFQFQSCLFKSDIMMERLLTTFV